MNMNDLKAFLLKACGQLLKRPDVIKLEGRALKRNIVTEDADSFHLFFSVIRETISVNVKALQLKPFHIGKMKRRQMPVNRCNKRHFRPSS
ncbi:hypothetical protein B1B05_05180 [Domibacillus enclensis]|uniref:Uncharacterized protein n=1 Tax=Domibacillus enclensis TaxID=1017273 RepID=A0ABX4EAW9_9BACI|nr:hypothetical protein B1B05_05180 [Domibacillus enclensis]